LNHLRLTAFAIGIFVAWAASAAAQEVIVGSARVIDGDTIAIGDRHVRLRGIDAPEKRQTCAGRDGQVYECGRDAAAVLGELTRGRDVVCNVVELDRYGRAAALCLTEAGDLSEAMVRRGWATIYPRYGGRAYQAAQREAQDAKLGLWSGRFVPPSDWRKGVR
jgi:endonuclease YncB( thermonuclease family)